MDIEDIYRHELGVCFKNGHMASFAVIVDYGRNATAYRVARYSPGSGTQTLDFATPNEARAKYREIVNEIESHKN